MRRCFGLGNAAEDLRGFRRLCLLHVRKPIHLVESLIVWLVLACSLNPGAALSEPQDPRSGEMAHHYSCCLPTDTRDEDQV